MAKPTGSIKHVAISKANTQVVIIAGVAAFFTVLSLVSAQSYISQNSYLSKVTTRKEAAKVQLESNLDALKKLSTAYNKFQNEPVNRIGGLATGTGPNDGKNAKIVLNALPSTYDFPALTSSVQKILTDRNLKVEEITGTDDEIVQQTAQSSPNPEAIPMAYTFIIKEANYDQIQDVIKTLDRSIRPMHVEALTITSKTTGTSLEVIGRTYYQPPKNLNITKEAIQP